MYSTDVQNQKVNKITDMKVTLLKQTLALVVETNWQTLSDF